MSDVNLGVGKNDQKFFSAYTKTQITSPGFFLG